MLLDDGGRNMLPHCGKWTNATGIVPATVITPMNVSPSAVENLVEVKNKNCVNPPPKLPPAPVRPEIRPNDLLETKGMMP